MRTRTSGREDHHTVIRNFLSGVLILVLVREAVAVPNLRGVAPQDEKYFQTAIIKCRDGSKNFVQERLNDDFCDCADGTDEPGTNACPEGKFYCKNAGHRPLTLFSSRVNDGICDCCDGSDEFDGKTKCSNTCWETGKQSREKLKKKLATFKEGSMIRKRDIENAQKLRQKHEAELIQLRGEEKSLKDVVAKLKVEKEAVEKAEKQEREEKERREKAERERMEKEKVSTAKEEEERKEKEKISAAQEEEKRKEKENLSAARKEERSEKEQASLAEGEEKPYNQEAEAPSHVEEVMATRDVESEGLDYLSEEERGRLIAARWTKEDVSDIISKEAEHLAHDRHVEEDELNFEEESEDNDEDDGFDVPHLLPSETSGPSSPGLTSGHQSSWWSKFLIRPKAILGLFGLNRPAVDKSEAERIRKEYQESHDKLESIRSQIADLESRTKQDFGKEGELYAFYETCFELKDKKYIYKVCPYKDSTQVEGHSTTRLGRWQGFKDDYKEMIFQNGDRCWNGPERSLRVKMRCGTKLELRVVDEPSRCEYVAEFSTPGLCLESKVQALEQQLSGADSASILSHDEL